MTTVHGDLLPAAAGVELNKNRNPWTVWCTGWPPSGQRKHWLLVADACPFCSGGGSYVLLVRSAEVAVT